MNLLEMLVSFTTGLPVILAVSVLLRPRHFRNIIISIFLLVLGYVHFIEYMIYTGRIYDYPHFFFLHTPLAALIGPILYFFIMSITHDKKGLERAEYLHFLPALLVILLLLPMYFRSTADKRQIVYDIIVNYRYPHVYVITYFSIGVLLLYLGVSIFHMWRHITVRNQAHRRMVMLLVLLIMILLTSLLEAVNIAAYTPSLLEASIVLVSLEIIAIFLLVMRYPYLMLYGTVPLKKKTPTRSYLESVDTDELGRQLGVLMNEEKFFCDEDLSLGRLSDALEVTPHQLSEFLNEHYRKNFNSYINGFRVDEAKKILLEEPGRNTMSIAYAVGFNSYSSFHRAFKKEAGCTPAAFREKNLQDPGR